MRGLTFLEISLQSQVPLLVVVYPDFFLRALLMDGGDAGKRHPLLL